VEIPGAVRGEACEILFDGSNAYRQEEVTLQELILDTLLLSPRECRAGLATHLVLSGGGVMLEGMQARLTQEVTSLLEGDDRYKELRGLVRQGNPLVVIAEPVFPSNCLSWVGSSLLGAIKGVDAGKVTKEQFLAQSEITRSPLQSLMPCWNNLRLVGEEDLEKVEEVSKEKSAGYGKYRTGSRRSSLEK